MIKKTKKNNKLKKAEILIRTYFSNKYNKIRQSSNKSKKKIRRNKLN